MLRSVAAMSHGGGGGGSGSCTSVSLAKSIRRALPGARKQRAKDKTKTRQRPGGHQLPVAGGLCVSSSVELISSSFSASSWSAAARKESVVRVVLSGGVVEVYAGVVLACTVIQKHPPGLCLAHPDVFRNPHGARVRPLEPLFPGQKFFLLPETTIQRLQRDIPEGSVGAFADEEEEEEEEEEEKEMSSPESEEERKTASMLPSGGCRASDYFLDRERWAEWHFKRMVAHGLAVEEHPQSAPERDKAKKRRRMKKKRKDLLATAPPSGAGCRSFRRPVAGAAARTWEPSLPSVEEEEVPSPDLQTDEPSFSRACL